MIIISPRGLPRSLKAKADTAVGVLQRAVSWFSARGGKVNSVRQQFLPTAVPRLAQAACQDLGIKGNTPALPPQTSSRSGMHPGRRLGPTPYLPRPNCFYARGPYHYGCTLYNHHRPRTAF